MIGGDSDASQHSQTSPDQGGIADLVRRAEPKLGNTKLVLIDGPSAAGKTTLAESLAAELDAQLIHTDDLLDGWDDQFTYWSRLEDQVLIPISQGLPGRYQRFDWIAERFADWISVPPTAVLLVEGVGAARKAGRRWASVTVFVDAPLEVRLRRSELRDGPSVQERLRIWRDRETVHFAADNTPCEVDLAIGLAR